jgi:hypothetical protein
MELCYLKFPILIHLLNNKAKHIVLREEELPVNHYFKIIKSGVNPDSDDFLIEGEFRVVEEEVNEPQETQKNIEPSEPDSEDNGAGEVIKDSGGTSL